MSAGWAQFQSDMHKARDAVKNSGTAMQRSMDKAKKSFDLTSLSITKLVGAVSAVYITKQLMQIADTYTLMDNKLKLVTGSADELKYVQEGLYQQSLRSFSSYESSVDLYSRFAKATETLGTSQGELLRITETLNKAMIISGATQEESKNAIIQLSQGMASGVLRGEEFNSIMENGSRIAKMLADYLHTDVGGLRAMAMEGKITSETMIKAFAAATDTIENEFSKMQPTIDQAMTNLKTVFGRLLSDSNKSAEGTKSVAEEIMKLADAVEEAKPGIIELFTGIIKAAAGAAKAIGEVGKIAKWLGEEAAYKIHGPAIGDAVRIQDDINKITDSINRLKKSNESMWTGKATEAFNNQEIARLTKRLEQLKAMRGMTFGSGTPSNPGAENYLPSSGKRAGGAAGKEKKEKKTEAEKRLKQGEQAIMQLEREKATIGDITREEKMRWEVSQGQYKSLSEAHKGKLVALAAELDALDAVKEADEEAKKNREAIEKQIDSLKEQAATFSMTDREATLYRMTLEGATQEQLEMADAMLAAKERMEEIKRVLEDIKTPQEGYNETIKKLKTLLEEGAITWDQYTAAAKNAADVLKNATDKGKDAFQELQQAIEGWGKDSAKAIADFAISGSASFSNMAQSIIKDMISMMLYQQMMKPLFSGISTSLFGDAATGATGLLSGIFGGGRAGGGSVSPGKMYEVNETGLPELLNVGNRQFLMMGNQSGYVAAAGAASGGTGGSGSGGGGVEVHIHNNNGSQVSQQTSQSSQGGTQIDVMIDAAVAKKMSTFGSKSNKALRSNFGAKEVLTNR